MAIYHARSSKKTTPLTPRFVALVALIAAVGFQASPSSSTSIFAFAAEDGTRGFTNRMLLQRNQADQEDAGDGVEVIVAKAAATCVDQRKFKIKPRKSKKKVFVCDYVKEDPDKRCSKTYKRKVKRKGKKPRTIKINAKKHCCETCSTDEPTPSPIEQPQDTCPEDEDEPVSGDLCISDREDLGFVKNQVCHYGGWIGTGCTEEDYQCQPKRTCTCGLLDDKTWACTPSIKPPDCDRDDPLYEQNGESCKPADSEPTSPPIAQTQSTCPLHVPFDMTGNGPEGHLCISDREELGFVMGQTCNYDYVGTGCTEEQYQCQPKYICSCGILDGATWTCTHQHLTGVGQYHECDRDPRPYDKSGEPCDPAASNQLGIRQ